MAREALSANIRIEGSGLSSDDQPSTLTSLWLPALAASLLLAALIHALLSDLNRSPFSGPVNREQVATYIEGRNDVWSKTGGTLSWIAPKPGDVFFREDVVATMAASEALIGFDDGSILSVEPNSLVVLERSLQTGTDRLEKISVKLVRGGLVRKKATRAPLEITYTGPESRIERLKVDDASGDSVVSVRSGEQGLTLAVEHGSVRLNDSASVSEAEQATVSANQVQVRPAPTAIPEPVKLPAPRLRKPKVTPEEGNLESRLELRRKPQWSGRPAWLLARAVVSSLIQSAAAEVKVSGNKPTRQAPKVLVDFAWEVVPGAEAYLLEVSDIADFRTKLLEERLQASSYQMETQAEKTRRTLYFRVAAVDAAGVLGEFSQPEVFEISSIAEIRAGKKPYRHKEPAAAPEPVVVKVEKKAPVPTPVPVVKTPPTPTPVPVHQPGFRAEAAVGAVYHHRDFRLTSASPVNLTGSGFIPGAISADGRYLRGNGQVLGGGLSALFEAQEPTTTNVGKEKTGIPVYRGWLLYGRETGARLLSAGLYLANTYTASMQGRTLITQTKLLYGPMLELQQSVSLARPWGWKLQLAGYGPAWGGDLWLTGRVPIQWLKLYRLETNRGLYVEAEALGRYGSQEVSYGGGLKVGYAY